MASKIVTLYIDDSNVRLLVIKGKQITKFATLSLEPGLIESGIVIKEAEVAAKLKRFLKEKKVKARRVILGISGLQCLTRPLTLPHLSGTLLNEAVLREAKRIMPLASEQFYIMWHTIPSPPQKTQVFVIAVRRRSTDSMMKMLQLAGIKVAMMDLKPLALTRLAKEPTAFILDVQPAEFDIVIIVDRVPQPIRTVSFPREVLSWDEKMALIRADLDRTIEFYNDNNPNNPLSTDIPIYVSGELADHPDVGEPLSSELAMPIMKLSSPNGSDTEKGFYNYMVNMGLALLNSSLSKMAGPSIADSNLLPHVYRPKPISLLRIAAVPSAVVIGALLIFMVILNQRTSANIASLRTQLETTNRLITQEQTKKNELKQKLTQTKASLEAFTKALAGLDEQGKTINGDMDETVKAVTVNTRLKEINYEIDTLTVIGVTPNEVDVLSYARNLDNSKRFGEVIITKVKNEDGGTDFTLALKKKEES